MLKALTEENGIMKENQNKGKSSIAKIEEAASVAAKEAFQSEASSQLLSSQSN
jgi:hypothetical protein